MDLIQNGGFEDPTDLGWIFNGAPGTGYSTERARTGVRSAKLISDSRHILNTTVNTPGTVDRTIAPAPGESCHASGAVFVPSSNSSTPDLLFWADTNPGDGSNLQLLDDLPLVSVARDSWIPLTWPPFTASGPLATVRWYLTPQSGQPAIYLDDLSIPGPEDFLMALREPCYVELFRRLQTVPGMNTCSRTGLRHWDQVADPDCPALFLATGDHVPQETRRGFPPVWHFNAEVWLYFRQQDASATPVGTAINGALDAIDTALLKDATLDPGAGPIRDMQATFGTTLAGLVWSARIVGKQDIVEAVIGISNTSVVRLTIGMLVTAL